MWKLNLQPLEGRYFSHSGSLLCKGIVTQVWDRQVVDLICIVWIGIQLDIEERVSLVACSVVGGRFDGELWTSRTFGRTRRFVVARRLWWAT